jgi:hypothetical protein
MYIFFVKMSVLTYFVSVFWFHVISGCNVPIRATICDFCLRLFI